MRAVGITSPLRGEVGALASDSEPSAPGEGCDVAIRTLLQHRAGGIAAPRTLAPLGLRPSFATLSPEGRGDAGSDVVKRHAPIANSPTPPIASAQFSETNPRSLGLSYTPSSPRDCEVATNGLRGEIGVVWVSTHIRPALPGAMD